MVSQKNESTKYMPGAHFVGDGQFVGAGAVGEPERDISACSDWLGIPARAATAHFG
jgi:hypothetical protein